MQVSGINTYYIFISGLTYLSLKEFVRPIMLIYALFIMAALSKPQGKTNFN